MPKILNRRNSLNIFFGILFVPMIATSAQAGSPVIIRHDAHLMEREIRINLAWQSDEPVARIIASAGKEQIVIDRNIDNERNEGGYSGEIDVVVPAYPDSTTNSQSVYISQQNMNPSSQSSMAMSANMPSPYSEVVQYTVQLVDEINQRSTLLKDNVRKSTYAYLHSEQQSRPRPTGGTVIVDVKDPLNTAINTTIGLIGKNGSIPVIKNFKVVSWAENQFTIDVDAVDDKGVDRVVFEVRNSLGNIDIQNSIACNSDKQCMKQSEPFSLNAGKNVLSIMAIDNEANYSKKQMQEFQISGVTNSVQQPSPQFKQQNPPPLQSSQPPPPQQPSPTDSNTSGVVYESQ